MGVVSYRDLIEAVAFAEYVGSQWSRRVVGVEVKEAVAVLECVAADGEEVVWELEGCADMSAVLECVFADGLKRLWKGELA